MSSILSIDHFDCITSVLEGKKVYIDYGPGNVGDDLIHVATLQFFARIGTTVVGESQADYFVWGGGGNLGVHYLQPFKRRRNLFTKAAEMKRPCVILPQSMIGSAEEFPVGTIIYAREKMSASKVVGSIVAPDMSLLYDPHLTFDKPTRKLGIYLRIDAEQKIIFCKSLGDPARLCSNVIDYLKLAAQYEKVVTNRLHFAISAMIAGREVKLLPNSYFKNWEVYDCWLKNLGCSWWSGKLL